ncbi:MAG TPA: hypothetical protein VN704_08740 [Verrucomicrobiae bacterium]|nr:hypothetical protein [Verrucomicrobiae bacterium]
MYKQLRVSHHLFSLFSYNGYEKNIIFESFTGIRIKEFDDIYNKEIAKIFEKHSIQRLSHR